MNKKEALATNIRIFRKNAGMSQGRLAEKLFVRTQTVSKWETGVAEPSIDMLCKLADVLQVSVDVLLDNSAQTAFVGIDGGASKTDIVLFTEDGHILARKTVGGTNPTLLGIDAAADKLKNALCELPTEGIRVRQISAGIAGSGAPERQKSIASRLKKVFPEANVRVRSDIMNVFRAAGRNDNTTAAICGTGVTVFVLQNEKLHRLGGWGQLFDGLGSGYDIGREALRAALAAEDGFGRQGVLTDSIRCAVGGNVFDWVIQSEHHDKAVIAALAPKVFEAYRLGDAQAERILKENFDRLTKLISFGVRTYQTDRTVLLSGGITAEKEVMSRFVKPEGITLDFPKKPQIFGACADAAFGSLPVTVEFEKNFTADFSGIDINK